MKKILLILPSIILLSCWSALGQGYSGLVGRWSFDGNANDVSGNNLHGIVRGSTLTTGMAGLPNTAYAFNGISNYIAVPSSTLMNTMVHSFCALIKPTGFYSGHCQGNAVIWRGHQWTSSFSYHLEFFDNAFDNSNSIFSPTQDVFAGWTGNDLSHTPQTEWYYTPTIVPDRWYNVVLTYDGDTTKIYVDGEMVNTFYARCSFSGSTDSLFFGKSDDGPDYPYWLNAVVDEIRIYNRVLSPAEVRMFGDSLGVSGVMPIKFFLDANNNCLKDVGEKFNLLPVTLEVSKNGAVIDTVSATSVLYYNSHGTPGDIFQFRVIGTSGFLTSTCPITGIITDTLTAGINPTRYFGFSCDTTTDFDLSITTGVSTDARGQTLSILAGNANCNPIPASLKVTFSPKFIFGSAYPAPASVSGNTAIWNVGTLSYLNSNFGIHATFVVPDTSLLARDTVNTAIAITPMSGDSDTANNIVVRNDTIRISTDPNDITVSPEGCLGPDTVHQLRYTIRFENTGNDTADNIYVLDTLSNNLDAGSLRFVAASHMMEVSRSTDLSGRNVFKFNFPNIKLLDSSYHNQCQGMLVYTINIKPGLSYGATIKNRVGIYFDANPVVLTNIVENTIGCPGTLGIKNMESDFSIYPNPANAELYISSDRNIENVSISNVLGQVVYTATYGKKNVRLDISELNAGVYILKVNNSEVRKIIKN